MTTSVRLVGLRRGRIPRALASLCLAALAGGMIAACEEPIVAAPRRVPIGDAGSPSLALAIDGEACQMDADCASGHCDNDVCCASGACCRDNSDCKVKDGLVCDQVSTCQGHRAVMVCGVKAQCEMREADDDDSACTEEMEADGCGLYASAYCSGKERQMAPTCPDSCEDDSGCDEEAHCTADGICVLDLSESGVCRTDSDCVSGHCDNQICCEAGACCNTAEDCDPTEFGSPPSCETAAMCQGTRRIPACENHQCTTRMIADDSACDLSVVANDCGMAADVKCLGGREQQAPPPCAGGSCRMYYDCSRSAFCQQGTCVPDLANGEECSSADMCQSGHCETTCCSLDCCDAQHRCPTMTCDEDVLCPGSPRAGE